MNSIGFIYGLIDPRNNHIRYVGQTSQELNKRLNDHIYDSRYGSCTHKKNWINLLIKSGLKPQIILIEECDVGLLDDKEIFWIKFYKNKFKLTNSTDGGDGSRGIKMKPETKAKLRRNNIGKNIVKKPKKK